MALLGRDIAGRYRLDRRVGAGGMSTVYLGFDPVLERLVAIKVLAEHLAEDEKFIARFRREALAAAKLVHPNVVQVFDSGEDPEINRHYIVMEYVEGRTVAELLREQSKLPVDEAARIVSQAARGLEYAHRHGVIHRDVKPGNLLVQEDGVVKLADFGIAKAAEDSRITQIGSVLGTAAYLSPERARGQEASPSSDVYSLGVVLYQLLAGRVPYETTSLTELALRQQEGEPEPLAKLNPDVPPELSRAVSCCLAPDPGARYASADEMREAIEEGARGRDTSATLALETAATRSLATTGEEATRVLDRTAATQVQPRPQPVAGRPAAAAAPAPAAAPRRKRGRAGRFFALLFLFVLIALIAAAVVVLVLDASQGEHFREVLRDEIRDQINGIKDLVDNATG